MSMELKVKHKKFCGRILHKSSPTVMIDSCMSVWHIISWPVDLLSCLKSAADAWLFHAWYIPLSIFSSLTWYFSLMHSVKMSWTSRSLPGLLSLSVFSVGTRHPCHVTPGKQLQLFTHSIQYGIKQSYIPHSWMLVFWVGSGFTNPCFCKCTHRETWCKQQPLSARISFGVIQRLDMVCSMLFSSHVIPVITSVPVDSTCASQLHVALKRSIIAKYTGVNQKGLWICSLHPFMKQPEYQVLPQQSDYHNYTTIQFCQVGESFQKIINNLNNYLLCFPRYFTCRNE